MNYFKLLYNKVLIILYMEQQYINTLIIDNIKYRYALELQYVETDEEKQEINKILSRYDKSTEKKIDEFNRPLA